jgi:plasmid stabilization system protein ParE
MRKIEWTPDGVDSLNEILEYYRDKAGENIANTIYDKIIRKIELLAIEKIKTKQTQELKDIGVFDIYELVIRPWKVYYKINSGNKRAYILLKLKKPRPMAVVMYKRLCHNARRRRYRWQSGKKPRMWCTNAVITWYGRPDTGIGYYRGK